MTLTEILTDADLSLLDTMLQRNKGQEDALITMLQKIQEVYSYLPEEVLTHLSAEANIPLSRIYAVATFYAQFHLTPRGRNTVRVCKGTACHVQGCDSIIKDLKETLGIEEGGTTEDLQFSLETVACLGTCFLAPVMTLNGSYHGKLDAREARRIIMSYSDARKEP